MPGFPLTVAATVACFHQAPATVAPTQSAVLIMGQPAATAAGVIAVAGCPFQTPVPKPQPCITIRWTMTSTKVLVQGQPLILMPLPGTGVAPAICLPAEQIPQGPAMLRANQMKVIVT